MGRRGAVNKYERIAPIYDLLDLAEHTFKRALRPRLFEGLTGLILDAGIVTGRNLPYYPTDATVIGLDASPAMLTRAQTRAVRLGTSVRLVAADIRRTGLPDGFFDGIVAAFVFGSLDEELQLPALREMARVCKPGGEIRLLDHSLSNQAFWRLYMRLWEPWERLVYGAGFEPNTERYAVPAGLDLVSREFLVKDMVKLLTARPACSTG